MTIALERSAFVQRLRGTKIDRHNQDGAKHDRDHEPPNVETASWIVLLGFNGAGHQTRFQRINAEAAVAFLVSPSYQATAASASAPGVSRSCRPRHVTVLPLASILTPRLAQAFSISSSTS